MMYIAYGLNHITPYSNLPAADIIAETFGTAKGISFAFMNISKISNQSADTNSNWNDIEKAYNYSINEKTNFIQNEVSILDPDIIITMGLSEKMEALGKLNVIKYGEIISSYKLFLNNKNILVLDTYHFSSSKKDITEFYAPIMREARNYFKSIN